MRVQIPAYLDHWMRDDRYGELVKTTRKRWPHDGTEYDEATVKLDKSGKTVRVLLDDCEEV